MDYRRLLLAAAEIVLSSNQRSNDSLLLDSAELGVLGVLKPHQVEGVSWLIRRYEIGVNVLLGDEMGLGKTVQAIAFMSYLKKHKLSSGPFLVLCPLSITDGWLTEFNKFCQNLKVIQYVGDREHRRTLRRMMYEHVQKQSALCKEPMLSDFDVLLTTYEIALMDREFLSQIPWHYAVIDEAQRLKNPSSVLYRALELEYIIPRRLLMTGTPIQNNLTELWSLMHFCMPSVFGTLEQFVSTFKDSEDSFTGQNSARSKEQLRLLKHVLKAFMLRRTKAKLIERGILTLPPLTEITVLVPFVALQRKVYMSILRRELPALLSLTSGTYSHQSLQNTVMQLRKVCSHPYLFNGIEPEPYVEGEHLVQAAGKLLVLDLLLQKLHADGHRVLIFAQMTRTLDILQDFLELRKYTYERLDGSIRAEERFSAIRKFCLSVARDMEPQVKYDGAFVFMISTRAGGVGLNLVAADTVIFYEQDWNPQVDKQALQRSHRIGQINHVLSINLVTQNTIEEVIMRRAERKLQLSNNVMEKEVEYNKEAGKDAWIDGKDMRSLILGLQVFDPTDSNVNNFNEENMMELNAMTEKVVQLRNCELSNKGDTIYEINPTDVLSHCDSVRENVSSFNLDIGLDETSYLSWIEKFKEIAPPTQNSVDQIRRKKYSPEERHLKQEADRRKAEVKKLAKWEAFGYHSLVVKELEVIAENDLISDSGSVQFVYGDCTKPNKICPSKSAIIFSCVDNSGNWGHGGMFTALTNLSASIPDAFHRAFEFDDLHMGDLHLVKLKESDVESDGDSGIMNGAFLWVALAVVQSYNSRRKVPRSGISIEDLETCLSKASISASQNSASIHMPRIGYQDGSRRSEWYTIERLLHKYASIHGINIFVYYYRRIEHREAEETTGLRAH